MAWTTADGALAATLEHRVGLARYGNGVLQRVIRLVNDSEKDIVRQIEKRFGSGPVDETHWAGKRLNDLLAQIRAINAEAHAEIATRLGEGLEAQASYEGEWTGELARRVGVRGNFVTPSAARLKSLVYRSPFAGGVLKDTVRRLETSGFERMKRALQIGLVQGESTDQIVRRITGSADLRYADGVTAVNRRGVERIVRTATTHVNVATQREIMAANPALYRGWMFIAVLDERTSLICMGLSGQTFPVDSGPFPPRHFWCRSGILPLLASNPEDPKIKNYEQWLREQPDDVQRQILGKTRFDLWKQGGLNLKHFVDGGRALTIAELRKWDEQAFIRAGLTREPGGVNETREDAIAALTQGAQYRSTTQARTAAARARATVLDLGIADRKERIVALGRNGLELQSLPGTTNFAAPTRSMWHSIIDPAERLTVHHNHPSSTSLSSGDVQMMLYPGIDRVVAHGHDGSIYAGRLRRAARDRLPGSFRMGAGDIPQYDLAADASAVVFTNVVTTAHLAAKGQGALVYQKLAEGWSGPLTTAEAMNALYSHAINLGLDRAGVIRYHARLTPRRRQLWETIREAMEPIIAAAEAGAKKWVQSGFRG